jgi:hypothetical protein
MSRPLNRNTVLLATWLYDWLLAHEGPLPPLGEIAKLYKPFKVEAYNLHAALRSLQTGSKLRWRSGTRSQHRGHQAIRIIQTGKVLKTSCCPFEAP